MRYQVVVLDEEIAMDITLDELGWQVHPAADPSAEFTDFKVYLGYCASDQLGSVFDDNYIPGTCVLVYDSASQVCTGSADEWFSVVLDTPFAYIQSAGNLIIETQWSAPVDGKSFYTWGWDTGSIRAVAYTGVGAPTHPTGSLSSAISRLTLTGQGVALEQSTFAAVKILGTPEQ
jgi:hypothetical protein